MRYTWINALACLLFSGGVMAAGPPLIAIAFAPDGQSVVVGSQAGAAVYAWPDLRPLRVLKTSVENVHDLTFSPDGGSLAVAGGVPSEQGIVEIVEWPSGESVFQCNGHDDTVMAVAWQTDVCIASASLDHEVAMWNVNSSRPISRLAGHSSGVSSVCFLAGGEILVSGGRDQNICVWDVESGRLIRTLNNHTQPIHSLSVRPSEDGLPMIASVSDDRTVRLWQPTIGRMVRFTRLRSVPLAVTWLPDGSAVVVAASDGHVQLLDPETSETVEEMRAVDGWAYSLEMHPTDGSVAVGGRDGQLKRVVLGQAIQR